MLAPALLVQATVLILLIGKMVMLIKVAPKRRNRCHTPFMTGKCKSLLERSLKKAYTGIDKVTSHPYQKQTAHT